MPPAALLPHSAPIAQRAADIAQLLEEAGRAGEAEALLLAERAACDELQAACASAADGGDPDAERDGEDEDHSSKRQRS